MQLEIQMMRNILHINYLTDTQVSRCCKAFANGSSPNIKVSKSQLSKLIQSEGILADLIAAIPQVMFHAGMKAFEKAAPELAETATKYYVNKGVNKLTSKKIYVKCRFRNNFSK